VHQDHEGNLAIILHDESLDRPVFINPQGAGGEPGATVFLIGVGAQGKGDPPFFQEKDGGRDGDAGFCHGRHISSFPFPIFASFYQARPKGKIPEIRILRIEKPDRKRYNKKKSGAMNFLKVLLPRAMNGGRGKCSDGNGIDAERRRLPCIKKYWFLSTDRRWPSAPCRR
jgi:hypothetical protein